MVRVFTTDGERKTNFFSSILEWISDKVRSPLCLSKLELRVYFKMEILMAEHKGVGRVSPRRRPNLGYLISRGLRSAVRSLCLIYRKKLKGYSRTEVETRVRNILVAGGGRLSYCFHCRKTGDITTPKQLCPHCHGWFVVEVDPLVGRPKILSKILSKGSRWHISKRLQRRCQLPYTPPLLNHAFTTKTNLQEEEIAGLPPLCSICQEEFMVGQSISRVICGHFYHEDCISPWLGMQESVELRNCPLCKIIMPTNDRLFNTFLRVDAFKKGEAALILTPPTPPHDP